MSFLSDWVMAFNILTGRESLFEGGGASQAGAGAAPAASQPA